MGESRSRFSPHHDSAESGSRVRLYISSSTRAVADSWIQLLEAREDAQRELKALIELLANFRLAGDENENENENENEQRSRKRPRTESQLPLPSRAARKDPRLSVQLVVYFDEAHVLTTATCAATADDEQRSLYTVLLSVLSDYVSEPLFVLFLSTISPIVQLALPGALLPSACAKATNAHQAPITETPFDCSPFLGANVGSGRHTLEEVSSIHFMAQFGRPLCVLYFPVYLQVYF